MGASQPYLDHLDEMKSLHIRKNAGYAGDSEDPWRNFRDSERLGVPAWKGALIRLTDKFNRVMNLANNPNLEQVGEAITDTMDDMAAYSLIARELYLEAMAAAQPQFKDVVLRNGDTLTGTVEFTLPGPLSPEELHERMGRAFAALTQDDPPGALPIIGCGNPWHYESHTWETTCPACGSALWTTLEDRNEGVAES